MKIITTTTDFQKVDFNRIRQKKVRKFIIDHGLERSTGFLMMKPMCYNEATCASYHEHRESFVVRRDIEVVWNAYKMINPMEAWGGEMVSFGLQYSRKSNSVSYLGDPYTGLEKGQIIILNLKLLFGLINIAVAHEVIEVNEEKRMIKLSYMENGASEGSQWISLHEMKDGFTQIDHQTLYKSASKFRDTKLYPHLHTKAIAEFHNSVKKRAEYPLTQAVMGITA